MAVDELEVWEVPDDGAARVVLSVKSLSEDLQADIANCTERMKREKVHGLPSGSAAAYAVNTANLFPPTGRVARWFLLCMVITGLVVLHPADSVIVVSSCCWR